MVFLGDEVGRIGVVGLFVVGARVVGFLVVGARGVVLLGVVGLWVVGARGVVFLGVVGEATLNWSPVLCSHTMLVRELVFATLARQSSLFWPRFVPTVMVSVEAMVTVPSGPGVTTGAEVEHEEVGGQCHDISGSGRIPPTVQVT